MKKTLISLSAVLLLTPGSLFADSNMTTASQNKHNTYKDNFYQTVNQTWLASNTITEDMAEISSFSQIDKKLKQQFQELISTLMTKSEPNKEEQMMMDFYHSYTNVAQRDKVGAAPLSKDLESIAKVDSYEALATIFAKLSRMNIDIPYEFGVGASLDDPTQYELGISESGIALPKKYYDNNSSVAQKKIKNLSTYYKDIATLAKFATVDKTVENCMAVEAKLAHLFWTPEKKS
jgi:predicted metalloendopeptidase